MDFVMVALMTIAGQPGDYNLTTVSEYRTLAQCQQQLAKQPKSPDIVSLVCAKKDWN